MTEASSPAESGLNQQQFMVLMDAVLICLSFIPQVRPFAIAARGLTAVHQLSQAPPTAPQSPHDAQSLLLVAELKKAVALAGEAARDDDEVTAHMARMRIAVITDMIAAL